METILYHPLAFFLPGWVSSESEEEEGDFCLPFEFEECVEDVEWEEEEEGEGEESKG